ncbi:P-type DNA transfer ATPase VirB11 [Pseudomonas alvandae]|uniref:P-type DNA transfer ATPase VirB11 n=1 Tax=Pseudomonas TaxID=286 RepID=UPI002168D82C|nr:P-type DNA transfer ATPase VirB11 [Pseudomonas sp. BIGb0381]
MSQPVEDLEGFEELNDSTLLRDFMEQAGLTERLQRKGVTEVYFNRPGELWTAAEGQLADTMEPMPQLTLDLCEKVATSLAAFNRIALSADEPLHTVDLPNIFPQGTRGTLVMPPACEKGTISLTIRKPSLDRFSLPNYQDSGRFEKIRAISTSKVELKDWQRDMMDAHVRLDWDRFFRQAMHHRQNIIIFGGPGSGKTTFAKALVDLYDPSRRLITIEAVNELVLPKHPNRVHLLYGQRVTPKSLVAITMRMKPDHLLLAELTGDEAWHFMESLNTGLPGTVTTAHANDSVAGVARICSLVKQSEVGKGLDYPYIERLVRTSFDIMIYMEKTYLHEVHYDPQHKLDLLNGVAA